MDAQPLSFPLRSPNEKNKAVQGEVFWINLFFCMIRPENSSTFLQKNCQIQSPSAGDLLRLTWREWSSSAAGESLRRTVVSLYSSRSQASALAEISHTDPFTLIFTDALSIRAKRWTQPRYPPMDKRIMAMCGLHSATKNYDTYREMDESREYCIK